MVRPIKLLILIPSLLAGIGLSWYHGFLSLTQITLGAELFFAIATALVLVLAFDRSPQQWVSLFFVGVGLSAGVITMEDGGNSLFYSLVVTQYGLLAAAVAETRLSNSKKVIIAFLTASVTTLVFLRSLHWIEPQALSLAIVGMGLILSLMPIVVQARQHAYSQKLWVCVVLQQTIIRFATIGYVFGLPNGPAVQSLAPVLMPIALSLGAAAVFYGILHRKPGAWERACQSYFTIFIISQSLHRNEKLVPVLLLLVVIATAFSTDIDREQKESSRIQGFLRALENGGLGSVAFYLTIIIVHSNRHALQIYEVISWTVLAFVLGGISWVRSIDDQAPATRKENMSPIIVKLVFQVIAAILVLSWYAYQVHLSGAGGSNV